MLAPGAAHPHTLRVPAQAADMLIDRRAGKMRNYAAHCPFGGVGGDRSGRRIVGII